MPDLSAPVVGGNSIRGQLDTIAKAENLTIRQMYERIVPTMGNTALIGTQLRSPTLWRSGTRRAHATDSCSVRRSVHSPSG